MRNPPAYDFERPIDPAHLVLGDMLIRDIVESRPFQRLKRIRFLGGIDYVLVRSPNGSRGRYTRYQHSLGVAALAMAHAESRELSYERRRLSCAAALLHDIGHAPLSHSLETVFLETFGIEHHRATEEIIRGQSIFGNELTSVLRWHHVDPEEVIAVISGAIEDFDSFFSGPINFDTIEGILRSHSYLQASPTTPKPHAVMTAALRRAGDLDRQVVDTFWLFKDIMYTQVINSRSGILADYICQKTMKESISIFSRDDYFVDEPTIFRRLPYLRHMLTSEEFDKSIIESVSDEIYYKSRRFFVDDSGDFFDREDRQRYKQYKVPKALQARKLYGPSAVSLKQDLFDDDRLRA